MKRAMPTFPLLLFFATGCVDPWEVGVVGVRKVFRVPVDPVAVEPPDATLEALVGEDGMVAILRTAGMPEPVVGAIAAQGLSFLDLAAVNAVAPLDDHRAAIEAALIGAMQEQVDTRARESAAHSELVTAIETDWSAWEAWDLDIERPNASISRALREVPVAFRIVVEAQSVADLVGSDLDELTDLDALKAVFVREVGLRTLHPEEVEPDDGWPNVPTADAAKSALTDPGRVDHCIDGQPTIDQTVGARIDVVSFDDPETHGTLAELSTIDSRSECGVLVMTDDQMNLKPYFEGGFRMTMELSLAVGTSAYDLGGYILSGVEGRLRIPSTL